LKIVRFIYCAKLSTFMNKDNNYRSLRAIVATGASGASTLAASHLLCPGHGTATIALQGAIATGLVTQQTRDALAERIEHAYVETVAHAGIPTSRAEEQYHTITEEILPAAGWLLLGITAYKASRAYARYQATHQHTSD